jgi:hypothetical protein
MWCTGITWFNNNTYIGGNMLPSAITQNGLIEDATFRIYLYLLSLCDTQIKEQKGKLIAATSIRKMAKDLHKTTRSCIKHVRLLEEMQWIKAKRVPNKTTMYYFGDVVDGKDRLLVEQIHDG